jgi:hypothetical protein
MSAAAPPPPTEGPPEELAKYATPSATGAFAWDVTDMPTDLVLALHNAGRRISTCIVGLVRDDLRAVSDAIWDGTAAPGVIDGHVTSAGKVMVFMDTYRARPQSARSDGRKFSFWLTELARREADRR